MTLSLSPDGPICVFDSGIGGLSVLRHLTAELPDESFLYVADSRHVPYGGRPESFVIDRCLAIAAFAAAQRAKTLVVACNTATAAAVAILRASFALPVIGIEPGIKPAIAASRSGVVGVLATENTLQSRKFFSLLERFGRNVEVVVQACPALVRQVEQGEFDGAATQEHVQSYVAPLLARGADVLVLGCTHFPFLTDAIRRVAGDGVGIIDTGPAVAKEVRRRLTESNLLRRGNGARVDYFTSGDVGALAPLMQRLQPGATLASLPRDFA